MNVDLAFYGPLVADIKSRIQRAQHQATLAVNAELLRLCWDIGSMIRARQETEGWGAGVIPRLARDLRNDLPELKGFSERNLDRMVQFAREYPGLFPISPLPVAKLEGERQNQSIGSPLAQRDINKPIGVADYVLTRALPADLASSLPSIEQIEAELQSSVEASANES